MKTIRKTLADIIEKDNNSKVRDITFTGISTPCKIRYDKNERFSTGSLYLELLLGSKYKTSEENSIHFEKLYNKLLFIYYNNENNDDNGKKDTG